MLKVHNSIPQIVERPVHSPTLKEFRLELAPLQERTFHFGSISLIAEPCKSAYLSAMKIANDAGALLSYDPNLRFPLWSSCEEAREGNLSILDKVDLIKVNEDEVAFITNGRDYGNDVVVMSLWHPRLKLLLITEGEKGCRYYTKVGTCASEQVNEDEVAFITNGWDYENDMVVMSLWHPGLKLLLITEGEKGCRYYTKAFWGSVSSIPVKTVDTTGAIDAYVGAFLTELIKDMSLLQGTQEHMEIGGEDIGSLMDVDIGTEVASLRGKGKTPVDYSGGLSFRE